MTNVVENIDIEYFVIVYTTFIYSIIPIHLKAVSRRKNERKRKVGKSSCKGLIMRIINNFVAEQVVNAYIYLF